jgi:hypothetical protein
MHGSLPDSLGYYSCQEIAQKGGIFYGTLARLESPFRELSNVVKENGLNK